MNSSFSSVRRRLLIALARLPPAVLIAKSGISMAAEQGNGFLTISKVIVGSDALSQGVADRIYKLLVARIDQFDERLQALTSVLDQVDGDRTARLSALTDDQVSFALQIAKPWYVGYVGEPSNFIMDDDAAFATFLEAQSYEKIIDKVPRPTYPPKGPGWWGRPPPGVHAPAMSPHIVEWTYHPQGLDSIREPDPKWRTYVTGKYDDINAARAAKPT